MKGIILAGGSGTRLHPLTKVTSKQLLPIYDKPMIYYPLNTLLRAGIRDILIIVAPERSGDFLNLLGSGKEFGARFTYEIQDKPEGLAQALLIGEQFIAGDKCALILGDNIYTDDFTAAISNFEKGAKVFAKKVPDPERFGVIEMDENGKVISMEEKPEHPKSFYAQTGFYLYDEKACRLAKSLRPSERGELEIVDLNNIYLANGELQAEVLKGEWIDAGTFESLHQASVIVREHELGMKDGRSNLEVKIKRPLSSKKESLI
ncbi:NTP transferase domain-containing protein [Patescibacteria group bacterium]|nr:NTP transferase domain-containing protein [Patescibacteria group bacterium]MBU1015762.1 NTP transferase domain-containing protein [Patescibacteria group bacterium]MBU1685170.1 NTP transferase domain-containing protein [Patescibacteria group bacterium]MBU1938306.1 NTP transferase domain-containing protein [Patescibacteria group bacterium]